MTSFEGEFINYYETFFIQSRKDEVEREIAYTTSCIEQFAKIPVRQVVDIGCGTGYHAAKVCAIFDKVTGVDISSGMIAYAKKNHSRPNLDFICQDMKHFQAPGQYDAGMMLSHVIGYQLDNRSVEEMLLAVNRMLKTGGVLLFNFYYAPALFQQGLSAKLMTVSDGQVEIDRFSNAEFLTQENALSLHYIYHIQDFNSGAGLQKIGIHEKMRYFSKPEISYFLQKTGFEAVAYYNHLSQAPLDGSHWNAFVAAVKTGQC